MSFIKKALRDAEAARPKAAPFTGPQMMTVDCPPRAGDGDLKVRARSHDSAATPVSASQSPTVQPTPVPVSTAPKETIHAEPVKPVVEAPSVIVASSLPVVAKPKPPSFNYKLQGIVYEPGRSSAVINGKTVIAGERVDGALVIKVDKDTVTIVNPRGETNLLEVP